MLSEFRWLPGFVDDLSEKFPSTAFRKRHFDFIKLLLLYLKSIVEWYELYWACSKNQPVQDAGTKIRRIADIIKFCSRSELEYRVGASILEFGLLGLGTLVQINKNPVCFSNDERTALRKTYKHFKEVYWQWGMMIDPNYVSDILGLE